MKMVFAILMDLSMLCQELYFFHQHKKKEKATTSILGRSTTAINLVASIFMLNNIVSDQPWAFQHHPWK